MRIGCQTYTWEMLGPANPHATPRIVGAIGDAGYAGIEITNNLIGGYDEDPAGFRDLLAANRLAFVAYAFSTPSGFTDEAMVEADLEAIGAALDFLAAFPGTVLSLGCPTDFAGVGESAAIRVAADLFNAAGAMGRRKGVPVAFHPSSHAGSVVLFREQYLAIMEATDPALVGWVPDTGHILRGRQHIRETLSLFASRIAYVHLKDAATSGGWRLMGEGDADIPGVIAHLRETLGFDGWLVAEEEAEEAGREPEAAVRRNHAYLAALVDPDRRGSAARAAEGCEQD